MHLPKERGVTRNLPSRQGLDDLIKSHRSCAFLWEEGHCVLWLVRMASVRPEAEMRQEGRGQCSRGQRYWAGDPCLYRVLHGATCCWGVLREGGGFLVQGVEREAGSCPLGMGGSHAADLTLVWRGYQGKLPAIFQKAGMQQKQQSVGAGGSDELGSFAHLESCCLFFFSRYVTSDPL